MQATRNITYEDCGRRFKLNDFADNNAISSVSGRQQSWVDLDGTASGMNEPTIIGSGLSDAGHWWKVETDTVDDPDGPLTFIKKNNGLERGLGHIRLRWKDEIHNTVGSSSCFNGPKTDANGNPYCPTIGKIRHIGEMFDASNDDSGGLPITANSEVVGPIGGFGWLLNLEDGPPKSLAIDQIEVDAATPLMLAIPYPEGTAFSISANGAWCWASSTVSCVESFQAVDSVAKVRFSQGNKYHYDTASNLLWIRIVQFPQTYTGDNTYSQTPKWRLWDLDDLSPLGWGDEHALDRFSFNGITLPKHHYGNYIEVATDCAEGAVSGHCANTPTYSEPQVCSAGYVQVAYDKCCISVGSEVCEDLTAPPTKSPTQSPTFGVASNRVYNPGFEDASLSPHWIANTGSIAIDTTESRSGTQSVLCYDRTSSWNGPQQDMSQVLEPGVTYTFSCWGKLKNASTSNFSLTLMIETESSGRSWTGAYGTINSSGWTYIERDITIPSTGVTGLFLYPEGPQAGIEFWVDDVSVIPVL